MSVRRGLFVQPTADGVGTTPVDARIDMAGLLTPDGDLGVVPGRLSGLTVTGVASGWAYQVSAGHAVTTRGATDGAVLLSVDGSDLTPAPVLADGEPGSVTAPVSGSRYEMIWILQRDLDHAEADNVAKLGVTQGTASGSPTRPDVPPGALVLAEALIPAGAANTAAGTVTITPLAAKVGLRGGIVTVANIAQRDRLNPFASPTTPVYVHRQNAPAGAETEYSVGAGQWRALATVGSGTLPHLRLTVPADQSRPGGAWSQVNLATATETAGDQPWSHSLGAVTINEAGLYQIDTTVTMSAAAFAVQIYRAGDTAALAQSPTGSGASFSNGASCTRRLAAGTVVVVRVYPAATTNVEADEPAKPSYVAFTKLSA